MTGTDIVAIDIDIDIDTRLAALAKRHDAASNLGVTVINLIGAQTESLLDRLPLQVRAGLTDATDRALRLAVAAAREAGGRLPRRSHRQNAAIATAMGAAGGMGGLPSAFAELPLTVTMLLRAIQDVAEEHGFDPADPEVLEASLAVFATAGPLREDDGADMGFLAARVTLTGPALGSMLSRIAPRLATALGQKLAAQAVPVLGAAAGAATNYAYIRYYQEMAHVVFGLRKLARASGMDYAELVPRLRAHTAIGQTYT